MTAAPNDSAPSSADSSLECDVLIIGSGAAALSAAVTAAHHGLKVIVAEKEAVLGGTSAWSGGWLWIPRNPLAIRAGIIEDESAPRQYLKSELQNRVEDPRIDTFLKMGPEMVSFFEENTALAFIDGNAIPDFHETDGHALGGRSVSAAPYDGRALGDFIHKLRPPLSVISLKGMGIASGKDLAHFFNATRSLTSFVYAGKRILRHLYHLARYGRGMHLVNGNALIARLLKSAIDLKVTFLTSAPAISLIGTSVHVTGAVLKTQKGEITVKASQGVVLGAGGFPHDKARIAEMFDHAKDGVSHFSAAPKSNTGDTLRMAEAIGAEIVKDLSNAGAWAPVSIVPADNRETIHFPHLVERAKPGFIAVLKNGQRFTNEADSYHDFMKALFAATPEGEPVEAWLICDHKAQRRYGLGWAKPFPFPLGRYIERGYLKFGLTLDELASACGIDAGGLSATIARYNDDVAHGRDSAFGKGSTAYNRIQGEKGNLPNPCLAPLSRAPYYAVRLVPGSLGTFAGLRTNENAEVISTKGAPIAGLYAVGNDMSSIFAGNYPSGGITLGPGMTFGYVVGKRLAEAASAAPPFKSEEP